MPRVRENLLAGLCILPGLAGLIIFTFYPLLYSFYLSFTHMDWPTHQDMVGLVNYARLFQDTQFWDSLSTTVWYTFLNVSLQTVLGLVVGLMLYRVTRSLAVRVLVVLPWAFAPFVIVIAAVVMLDWRIGINAFLSPAQRIPFFNQIIFLFSLAFINAWRNAGLIALVIDAARRTIPQEVYDAARLDGLAERRAFWSITLPILRPVLVFVVGAGIVGAFVACENVAWITQPEGGPGAATRVLMWYSTKLSLESFHVGYGATVNVFLCVIILLPLLFLWRYVKTGQMQFGPPFGGIRWADASEDRRAPTRRNSPTRAWKRILGWSIVLGWVGGNLLLLGWMLRLAFSDIRTLINFPTRLLPVEITVQGLQSMLDRNWLSMLNPDLCVQQGGWCYWPYLLNTLGIFGVILVGQLVVNTTAGYAFARLRFPLRTQLLALYACAMFVPGILMLVSNYILIDTWPWGHSMLGISAPYFLGSAWGVFVMRQWLLSLNGELEAAARLEGASGWKIFTSLIWPACRLPLMVLAALLFIWVSQDLVWPFYAGKKPGESHTGNAITMTLSFLYEWRIQTVGIRNYPHLMANALLISIPSLLAFIFVAPALITHLRFSGERDAP